MSLTNFNKIDISSNHLKFEDFYLKTHIVYLKKIQLMRGKLFNAIFCLRK